MRNKTITRCLYPLVLVVPHYLQAAPACSEAVAKILSAQGRVDMQPYGTTGWQRIHQDDTVCPGDTLRTLKWSRATLALRSKAVITLDQGTTMSFSPPKQATQSWFLDLLEGTAFFRSRQPQRLDVHTPFINAVHKGTEFMVTVTGQQTEISVFDGQVQGESSTGNITIDKGFKGIAEANRPPRLQALKVTPEDAVQWTLYYPPLVDTSGNPTGKESALAPALLAYREGDSAQALAKLEEIPAEQQNAGYLTLKAALLLAVGRVDEAQPLIRQAQNQEPNNADAFALQAVIAVAKNQQQQALALANQAVSAKPNSPVAKIAQSYAYQSLFNIDEALKATQEATRITPDNALAWARLSELQLSKGDRAAALASAQKAQALNPKLARTQTVLGFASLAQTDIQNAKQAFGQALVLDSSDPIARLGLGLAKIRQGDVEDGKDELETAVNLDPDNAVIRSYLGKAYYELRNKDYAGTEYNIAKDMDPKDPTPWFYDAILKQTTNRPVEALEDIQKAIKLNGNRAVYRSSLLLDKDLAARSAAQGRIYSDLGFQQLGLVEGWKSVNTDPSDYSGHRLLADSYSVRSFYEIARVSELLQSQLLQPINMTPVQPHLGEKNLLTLDGAGPASSSFNEFNPLFTRDRFSLQTSGVVGSNNTYGDEVVHSGLWRNLSYSIGQYHYESGGFRQNNDVHVDLFNGFIQAALTPNFSVQAEIRHKRSERGDIDLSGDGSFFKDFRLRVDSDTYRGGLHYKIDNHSDLIASYVHLDSDSYSLQPSNDDFGTLVKVRGDQGEIQHLFRSDYLSAVTGFGLAKSLNYLVSDPQNVETISHTNGYLYTYTHYPRDIDWTLGFSVDSIETNGSDPVTQVNPKVGMIWRAMKGTTIRWAISRTLKRSLITNQTIEPTQVAGFNQFFDDYTQTNAWLYGFAVDQKFGSRLFSGVEFIARDLSKLIGEDTRNWNERSYRAYLDWNISPRLASTFSFHLEEFQGDKNISTSLVPLSTTTYDSKAGLRFFDPSGFFCNVEAEYVNQRTSWPDAFVGSPTRHNEFVLVNAGVGYRFPRRLGIVQLDFKNIFDRQFNYQSLGPRSPQFGLDGESGQSPPFIPGRTIFARFTLAF